MKRTGLTWWLIVAPMLPLAGCGGPDWEEICDEFKAINFECSSGTQAVPCNPDAYEECDNEDEIAAKFDECNAIGTSDCPAWANCFLPDMLPECIE